MREICQINKMVKLLTSLVSFKKTNLIDRETASAFGEWITSRAKFIPLRFTIKERKFLRLLEAALKVSEYTDKIDILSYQSKSKRIVKQITEVCAILSGLALASDYKVGQELLKDKEFKDNEMFFASM